MSTKQNSLECNTVCWGIAFAVGLVSMVMLYMLAEFSALQAIFTGGLIGFLLGCLLSIFVCRGPKQPALNDGSEKPAQRYAREAAEDKARREANRPVVGNTAGAATAGAAGGAAAAAAAPSGGTDSSGGASEAAGGSASADSGTSAAAASTPSSFMSSGEPAVKPSTPLAGQAELASRKGSWKYEGGSDDGSKGIDAVKAVPAGETAAPAVAPSADAVDAATVASEPEADAIPETTAPSGDGVEEKKPMLYDSAPAEGADDLKLISGVGPKLEQTLNEMGIYRFDQVAVWGPQEIAWVDERLRFKGRIERDDWMSQAKILAAGGETEFSKRKKK